MDYGTGHETSFALFLLCLTLLRFLEPEPRIERQLVLNVFVRYLRLCWRLQDVYKLEPAGSHGVWGLDDYSFLSYVFGSAQLRGACVSPAQAWLDGKRAGVGPGVRGALWAAVWLDLGAEKGRRIVVRGRPSTDGGAAT